MTIRNSEAMKQRWQKPESRPKIAEAMNSLEVKAKMSEAAKKRWQNPEYRDKVIESINRPESRNKHIELLKKFYENSDNRIIRSKFMKMRWQDPEYKLAQSIVRKKRWQDPDVRIKQCKILKEIRDRPEVKAKYIETLNRPDVRTKCLEILHSSEFKDKISGKNNSQWKGGVSFEPYCSKFNKERKEIVRNNYERVCANCGKSELQNGAKLSVHHVDANKMQGCRNTKWFLVPLCKVCHGEISDDNVFSIGLFWLKELSRKYWERRIV
jgi:hypothetical protein